MWPSVVFGAAAIGRPRPAWLRTSPGGGGHRGSGSGGSGEHSGGSTLSGVESVLAVAWYVPMLAIEAWAFSVVFAPAIDGAPVPSRFQKVLIGVPVAAMAVFAAVALGLPGM